MKPVPVADRMTEPDPAELSGILGPMDRFINRGVDPAMVAGVRNFDDRRVLWCQIDPTVDVSTAGGPSIEVTDQAGGFDQPAAGDLLAVAAEEAVAAGLPFIAVIRQLRLDGLVEMAAWGRWCAALQRASGVVPTLVILDGHVSGACTLALGLVDVVVMTTDARANLSAPRAIATVTGRETNASILGDPDVHHRLTGLVAHVASDLAEALLWTADLLSHLPADNQSRPPAFRVDDRPGRATPELADLVPADGRIAYDMRDVVQAISDDHHFLELRSGFGPTMIVGFVRFGGISCGVVANQPQCLAGAIDIESSQKAARFVNWCDAYGLPLVTLVDTPGYLPGRDLEWAGMIRHGGQLAFAYAEATVGRVSLILRKAFGGAYIVMDSRTMGNHVALAWPGASIAVMGAQGAVQIVHGRRLSTLAESDEIAEAAERQRLEDEYTATYLTPHEAVRRGFVDELIEPAATRSKICSALATLVDRRPNERTRRHANSPL